MALKVKGWDYSETGEKQWSAVFVCMCSSFAVGTTYLESEQNLLLDKWEPGLSALEIRSNLLPPARVSDNLRWLRIHVEAFEGTPSKRAGPHREFQTTAMKSLSCPGTRTERPVTSHFGVLSVCIKQLGQETETHKRVDATPEVTTHKLHLQPSTLCP